jgi:hypothetical protein
MAQISTIAINSNNDIYLDGNNNIAMKKDINAIADIVLNKVRTNLGELQFNIDLGIPYFTTIFTSTPNFDLWQKFVEDSALSLDNVIEIVSFSKEINNYVLSYSMTIKTDFGSVTVNG